MTRFFPLALALALALLGFVALAAARPPARAALAECPRDPGAGRLVWAESCDVSAPLALAGGQTLTIGAGVTVRFAPGAELRIEGGLDARGSHARQIRLVAAGERWPGLVVAQPDADVLLQSVTVSGAATGLEIRPPSPAPASPAARVEVSDSLFYANGTAVAADFASLASGPSLMLRNNLLVGNGIGLQLANLPDSKSSLKLDHNSFSGNGIGLRLLGGGGLKAKQQWWGSASGPEVSCIPAPVPRADSRDRVCGLLADQARPWSKVPAGRAILPAGSAAVVESGLGQTPAGDDGLSFTSVATLTVPTGAFTQPVDLIISGRAPEQMPPVAQPGLRPTRLFVEVTAAAGGQEIHRFAGQHALHLEIRYRPEDLAGADPSKLALYYYDEALGAWSAAGMATTPDPDNQRITVRLDHLSRMNVSETEIRTVRLPLLAR